MKKWKVMLLLGLMVSPIFFTSCEKEKDEGTVSYSDVSDADWKCPDWGNPVAQSETLDVETNE